MFMLGMEPHQKLQRLLEQRGLSQAELARRAGIPQPSVNEIVNGRRRLFADLAWTLARVLEVPLDFLLDPAVTEVPPVPGARERQVREIAEKKGWDWIYWRIVDPLTGGPVHGFAPESPTYAEQLEAERKMSEQIKKRRGGA